MWSENICGFVGDHRVIAFDALGDAGLSVQSAPMESFENQALWMEQVLAELTPPEPTLLATLSEARLPRRTRVASPDVWSL
jgi:hypothetical protein